MAHLLQDLRYALRQIRRSPGFALTAVLTLAIGIGATTAIFSFVDGVLLQPLAYRNSGQLVTIWDHAVALEKLYPQLGPSTRHALMWRQSQNSFSELSIVNQSAIGVSTGVGEHPLYIGRVSTEPNLMHLLGVQPALGRDFLPDEGVPGRDDRGIISWNLWQTLFHGDPGVLGKTLRVGTKNVQIVGVLPHSFYFPKSNELTSSRVTQQAPAVDLFVPIATSTLLQEGGGWNSDYGNYVALGRLKPGITPATAQAELDVISDGIVRQAPAGAFTPGQPHPLSTVVVPLKSVIVGDSSKGLYLLLAAVLSVLLIACINLANAQLARVMARDREAALRTALGASAWALVQASVLESLLLSIAGGSLGVALAAFSIQRFSNFVHVAIPRAQNITLNPTVLTVSIACTVAATLLFGALPALRFTRANPQAALAGSNRSAGSASGSGLRRWLIAAQLSACTALLLLTTAFARNLSGLLHAGNNLRTGGTVVASVRPQGTSSAYEQQFSTFNDAILLRLHQLPGVTSAAAVSSLLSQGQIWLDGVKSTSGGDTSDVLAEYRWISPEYFDTIGQAILQGRALDARDRTLHNAVISRSTAEAVWPHLDPIGRTFTRQEDSFTVVGVAADTRSNSPREAPISMVFLPIWEKPPARVFFLAHGTEDPTQLALQVRQAIWAYDPGATITGIQTLEDQLGDTLAPERLQTDLLAGFGVAALLLALLGIYGTLNYSIGRRTQEFGIRMALGASRGNVYWITFREVALSIALGLLGGWAASLVAVRVVRSLLEGTPQISTGSVATVLAALVAATLLAAFLPCRRASQLQPMDALRAD